MSFNLGQKDPAYIFSCDGGICSASEKSAVQDTANSSGNDFIETHQDVARWSYGRRAASNVAG